MAGYNSPLGRKQALNVSQYVANLNAIPDLSAQQQQQQDTDFDIEDELARFTNTEFLDFDAGVPLFDGGDVGRRAALDFDALTSDEDKARRDNNVRDGNQKRELDFANDVFPFQPTQQRQHQNPFDLSIPTSPTNIGNPLITDFSSPTSGPPPFTSPVNVSFNNNNNTNTPYGVPTNTTTNNSHHRRPHSGANALSPTSSAAAAAAAAEADTPSARAAAEEDKRRRNTAASARFRVKKKQREQKLEKELEETKAELVEVRSRAKGLEKDVELLKGLLMGGRNGNGNGDGEGKVGERSSEGGKKGVGTKVEE